MRRPAQGLREGLDLARGWLALEDEDGYRERPSASAIRVMGDSL